MYATKLRSETRNFDRQGQAPKVEVALLYDPSLLRAARQIYRTYYEVHPEHRDRPVGIAIHQTSHRGKLIFGPKPILLPQECFIPLIHIESDLLSDTQK